MTTILFVFSIALVLGLTSTPAVQALALRFGYVHEPSERCMHTRPIPRIGGVALFVSFFMSLVLCLPFQTQISVLLHDPKMIMLFLAAALIFFMGLLDDIHSLPASVKLAFQITAACLTWYGGIRISGLSTSFVHGSDIGWLSLPATVFWIVLITNAINLIDGLDGLAAGISLFASLIMLLLCMINGNYLVALCFAALTGSLVGFLRYNFNPATIFMGDSGSYFLGYTFAALSILGSVKGQATAALLIPFITLGVPLFDTMLSPMRRFARGKGMFTPDSNHLHHRIMQEGNSHRKTVLILYAATLVLGGAALAQALLRDELAGLVLLVPAIVIVIAFKNLGYLHYLAIDKIYGWVADISDVSHISRGSRTFLDHQLTMRSTESYDALWSASEGAFAFLNLDHVSMELYLQDGDSKRYEWTKQDNDLSYNAHVFKVQYPLTCIRRNQKQCADSDCVIVGMLHMSKDISKNPIRQFTMRRIEQLKREMAEKLTALHPACAEAEAPATEKSEKQSFRMAAQKLGLKNSEVTGR